MQLFDRCLNQEATQEGCGNKAEMQPGGEQAYVGPNQMNSEGPAYPRRLRVQLVVNGEVEEYIVQEDVEQAIQRECKV